MESLKAELLISLSAVKAFQEGSEMYKWYDGRIRYLLELLYGGSQDDNRLPQNEGESLSITTRRSTDR